MSALLFDRAQFADARRWVGEVRKFIAADNGPTGRAATRLEGTFLDVAEPPRIVFESHARCADGRRGEEVLRQVLTRSRAPGKTWVVTMRIDAAGPGVLHGVGEIANDDGAEVGRRVFVGKPGDCAGLASAVGIWASLVLDAELTRPHIVAVAATDEQGTAVRGPAEQAQAGGNQTESTQSLAAPVPIQSDSTAAAADATSSPPDWPSSGGPSEKPSRRDDSRALELGVAGFLMSGAGGGDAVMGASPFFLVEVAKGVLLRPALAVGVTIPAAQPAVTWAVTRFDGCLRVAGLYTNLQGIQLDVCGGVDGGVVSALEKVFPYVAVGPSFDLRGELNGDLAVSLRGLFGFNAVHETSLDTPLVAGRGEVALSWRLQ